MADISKLIQARIDNKPVRATLVPPTAKEKPVDRASLRPRRRALLNIIPSSEELDDLIHRALAALSAGIYWDRGSIVNILL